jgi:hypothetical protein
MAARAVVNGPLAFTELALTFDNPRDRAIEGTFSITLPPRATITRFAMRTAEAWQEGEVVELQAARRAYEDFLHRRQDPALLERGAGNQFTARVFPIAARAAKELIVAYAEELASDQPYTLALKGLPEIADLDVAVTGGRGAAQVLKQERSVPSGDLVFDRRPAAHNALRSKNHLVARVKAMTEAAPDPIRGLLVLFDTSGSRALGFQDQTRLLADLVRTLTAAHGPFALRVACFDQTVESVFDGQSSAFGDRELLAIKARSALGTSNLERALGWAKDHVAGTPRVLVVTDGVMTAGASDTEHLRDAAFVLQQAGVARLDAVAIGGIRDEAALKALVLGGRLQDGIVASADLGADHVAKKLGAATRSGIGVRVEGATFSYPEHLDGVQPGDEALVYAELPEGAPLRVSLGNAPALELVTAPVEAPLLTRAFAQARIGSLLEREARGASSPDLHAQIVELAVRHRVVTPYTALLVLETAQDYERFGIQRRSLADILTVRDGKLVATSRSTPIPESRNGESPPATPSVPSPPSTAVTRAPPPPSPSEAAANAAAAPPPAAPSPAPASAAQPASPKSAAPLSSSAAAKGDAFGAGQLDLSKVGEGGGGRGEGIGLGGEGTLGHGAGTGSGFGAGAMGGAHQTRAPTIRQGATQVNGRLPPEVIQRIVRQNFGRFRLCYENGLRSNPNLQGRVSVRFVIDRSGAVDKPADAGSDLPNASVIQCILRGFGNLSFPQPEGGIVTVVFPIIFTPGEPGGSWTGPIPNARYTPPAPEVVKPALAQPYDGKLREVMDRLAKKDVSGAKAAAQAWHDEDPGDILGLVALGEALSANREIERAARAYGSIIDLFPARADMRRFAGSRLEGLKGFTTEALDTYAKAKAQRPDHPSSHRLHVWALVRAGQPEKAFDAAVEALRQPYPEGRFPGVHQVLQEDIGLVGAAWAKAEPKRAAEIRQRVTDVGGKLEDAPSLRFVLTWETDANDVDFHIYDSAGGHAFYGAKHLRSGGDLYADITTGYGPECFTIRLPKERRAAAYTLQANYYSRGPMGYGMGKLEVIDHDGHGGLTFEQHPYVVMVDRAFVNLGVVKR